MDGALHAWVAVTALAVVLQVIILGALVLGFWLLKARIERTLDRDVDPLLSQARELVAEGRKAVDKLNGAADDVAGFARTQAGRLDLLMAEAADRTRLQIIRADQLVAEALTRIEKAGESIERSVGGPIREMQAVLVGVRAALDLLFGRRRTPAGPVERTPQDEGMFI